MAVTLARELEIVRDVLAEAGRVLGDEALRRRYREHLLPADGPPAVKVVFFGSPEFAVPSLRPGGRAARGGRWS